MKLRAEHPDHGVTTGSVGEIHDALTGWFINDLDQLLLVDALLEATVQGSYRRHALAVQLGVDIDEV